MGIKEQLAKAIAQKRGFTDEVLKENEEIISSIEVVNDKTIAVIESFRKHAEVYPAIIYYFLEMGYDVHLFRLQEHQKDESLCRANFDKDHFKIFQFPIMPESESFFELLNSYKFIFVNTIFTHDGYNFANALDGGYLKKYNKDNVYFIDHDFVSLQKNLETIEKRMFEQNKLFVLRDGIEILGQKLPYVSPTWFGEYRTPTKKEKTHFICVGGGYQKNLRNFERLFCSLNSLIEAGNTDFDLTVIGATREMLDEYLTAENEMYINILGFATYEALYKCMEASHFIIFNIDETCNEYEKYLKTGITGSYSLSLAFSKPAIILEDLAKAYGFTEFSLMYSDDLAVVLRKAIETTQDEYQILQKRITDINNNLQKMSIKNLKTYIETKGV